MCRNTYTSLSLRWLPSCLSSILTEWPMNYWYVKTWVVPSELWQMSIYSDIKVAWIAKHQTCIWFSTIHESGPNQWPKLCRSRCYEGGKQIWVTYENLFFFWTLNIREIKTSTECHTNAAPRVKHKRDGIDSSRDHVSIKKTVHCL